MWGQQEPSVHAGHPHYWGDGWGIPKGVEDQISWHFSLRRQDWVQLALMLFQASRGWHSITTIFMLKFPKEDASIQSSCQQSGTAWVQPIPVKAVFLQCQQRVIYRFFIPPCPTFLLLMFSSGAEREKGGRNNHDTLQKLQTICLGSLLYMNWSLG